MPSHADVATSRRVSPAVPALGGALVAAIELVSLTGDLSKLPLHDLGLANYLIALFVVPILVAGSLGVLFSSAGRALERWCGSGAELVFWLLVAATFGYLWQDAVMHGDGIRTHPRYDAIRTGGAIAGPLGILGFTYVVAFWSRVPLWVRRALALLAALGAAFASQSMFSSYREFHGFLAIFLATATVWLFAPLLRSKAASIAAWTFVFVGLAFAVAIPGWQSAQRHVQRYSHLPAAMLTLPAVRVAELSPEPIIRDEPDFTIAEEEAFRAHYGSMPARAPRGRNVLLVILEATRADAWVNPAHAPKFHAWRKHGTYFPYAVSQYPATPLAYGAMFTSHPPSVLTSAPGWAKSRLFDRIAPQFDRLILSRPRNVWFEHDVIPSFFAPRDAEMLTHDDAAQGMENVQRELAKLKAGDSFFAWVHLYEPHRPFESRPKFYPKVGTVDDRVKYLGEVSYVDDALGGFMDWFYRQPVARDTLVVVVSDHGEGLGERIDGTKYEGHHVHVRNLVSHVPAFFSGPGIPVDRWEEDFTVQQLDVMPTIFDFLGVALPADAYAEGSSLYELFAHEPRRALVSEAFAIRGQEFFAFVAAARDCHPNVSLATLPEVAKLREYAPKVGLQYGDEKVIRDMLLERTWLYDVRADPQETRDLWHAEPERRAELASRLDEWRRRQAWVVRQLSDDERN